MKLSRRHFIQSSGLFLGASTAQAAPPIGALAEIVLGSAKARGDDVVDRNYLNINIFGSPNRWVFDQFLRTKAGQNVNAARMAATKLSASNGVYNDAEYATVDYKGMQVPPMWLTNVRSSTGIRNLSELAEHMIVFRGFGSGVDGHPGNLVKQFLPLPSAGSTTGNMADHSAALMKAVQFPNGIAGITAFASPKGLGASAIGYGGPNTNAIATLMNPFTKRPEAQGLETMRSKYQELIEVAQTILNQHSRASSTQMDAVQSDQAKALKTLRDGLEDLDAAWGGLYGKYRTICEGTMRDRGIAGFSDLAVQARDDDKIGNNIFLIISGDAWAPINGFDIREIFANAQADVMAQSFALAEFVFTRGLTNAMEMGSLEPNGLSGMFRRSNTKAFDEPRKYDFGLQFDEHSTGVASSVAMNSNFYRGLAAGMAELVSVLKSKDLFNKTVIQVVSEFGRAPRDSGDGSDHGFDSMASSMYTGMHSGGPMVLGNIKASGTYGIYGDNYAGTFGTKAPTAIAGAGTAMLGPGHVAASLAVLLGFKHNPWANSSAPLLYLDNGKAVAKASAEIV